MTEQEQVAKIDELNKRLFVLEQLSTPGILVNPHRLTADLDDIGSVKTHLDFEEAPLTPVTPPANVARVYAEDDGAGTTRWVVKLSDGTALTIHPLALTSDISPAQITGNQDNYNPTGLATAEVLRLSTDASRNITGLAGGSDGRAIILHNVGAFNIVLPHDVTSTVANRFYCANSMNATVVPNGTVILVYDAISNRWRVFQIFSTVDHTAIGDAAPHHAALSTTRDVFIPPAVTDSASTLDDWPFASLGSTAECKFIWYVPANFLSLTLVSIIMIPDTTETVQADLDVSVAAISEGYDSNVRQLLNQTKAVNINAVTEWDIKSIGTLFTGITAGDFVAIRFQSDTDLLRIIGCHVRYEVS